jgi:hypothetical protein
LKLRKLKNKRIKSILKIIIRKIMIKTEENDTNDNKIIVAYNRKLKIDKITLAYIIIVNNICNNNIATTIDINT